MNRAKNLYGYMNETSGISSKLLIEGLKWCNVGNVNKNNNINTVTVYLHLNLHVIMQHIIYYAVKWLKIISAVDCIQHHGMASY